VFVIAMFPGAWVVNQHSQRPVVGGTAQAPQKRWEEGISKD